VARPTGAAVTRWHALRGPRCHRWLPRSPLAPALRSLVSTWQTDVSVALSHSRDLRESTERLRAFDDVFVARDLASPKGGVRDSLTWMETVRQHGCESPRGILRRRVLDREPLSKENLLKTRHSADMEEPVSRQPTVERPGSGNHPVPYRGAARASAFAQRACRAPRALPRVRPRARRLATTLTLQKARRAGRNTFRYPPGCGQDRGR